MRMCLVAWGSRGDVQPFVALARELRACGYDATVAAMDDLEPLVTGAGVPFDSLGIELRVLMQNEAVRTWLTASSHSSAVEARRLGAVTHAFAEPAAAALTRLVPRYDAFISGLLTADTLGSVAAPLGKQHVMGLLAPGPPTRVAAAQMKPLVRHDSVLNLLAGKLGNRVLLRIGAEIRHEVESALGTAHRSITEQIRTLAQTPTLIAASPLVVPAASDWPEHVALTGYWTLGTDPSWRPDDALAAWLENRPVQIGFGSMPVPDVDAHLALLDQALTQLDLTATVQGVGPARQVSERMLAIGDVPHGWLFPRVRAVVHHGGAGTTSAALRAGAPQVVVPHMGDQPYWASRVADLGCAAKPIARHRLSADLLARRITEALEAGRVARAQQLGRQLDTENGCTNAVHLLTKWRVQPTP